jgi:HAD superfamily hydrolase (TIGR01509 family)
MSEAAAPQPAAVVFDCDGTIADTERLSDIAWTEVLLARGYEPTSEDFRAIIGHPFPQNWAYFAERASLGEQERFRADLRVRFRELFERELTLYPDAVETMRSLAADGVPLAVASSSSHAHVDAVLAHDELAPLVSVVIGADDVERHKPHPEPYLAAAAALGVPAARCSAVEDTSVGVASATGAGMFTVGVLRAHGHLESLAAADLVVDELRASHLVHADEQQRVAGG